jgi:hypothetical protein
MNSLEISLVLLAVVAIFATIGYNVWVGRKRSARAPRMTGSARGEPGLGEAGGTERGGGRDEPSLGAHDEGFAAAGAGSQESQGGGEAGLAGPGRAHAALNPIADCVVELVLSAPLSGDRLIQLTRGMRRAGSKPVLVEALPADAPGASSEDEPDPSAWQQPVPGRQYVALRAGVLLANRHGPLNAMEFSEFVTAVQSLADQLSVLADTPDMASVLARARDLDEVCANLDAQLGIAVEAPEVLGLSDLASLAAECGCVERGNNRYARLGPGGEVLFSLALADAPNRLQLLLDVPRAPASLEPWRAMVACGRQCAQRLGGPLVDDAGRPLPDTHIARIDEQIAQRYASLEDAGFPAGSSLALRVFN